MKTSIANAAVICFVPMIVSCTGDKKSSAPNIILIMADDIGYGDLSCYGAIKIKTPNVDCLAASGVRFMNAHSAAATSTPSRYALLTGEYAFRRDDTGIAAGNAPSIIKPEQKTVAAMLKAAGYTTAAVGKWHLGMGVDTNQPWNDYIAPGPKELALTIPTSWRQPATVCLACIWKTSAL